MSHAQLMTALTIYCERKLNPDIGIIDTYDALLVLLRRVLSYGREHARSLDHAALYIATESALLKETAPSPSRDKLDLLADLKAMGLSSECLNALQKLSGPDVAAVSVAFVEFSLRLSEEKGKSNVG